MSDGPTPDFFIIGAAKAGTTSLHFYLDQHPEVSMSRIKEPCVFSEPLWWPRLNSYDGLFDPGATCRGESSTSYSRYPVEGDAAGRIHQAVPSAKLIYLVREPIGRIVSEYIQHAEAGIEQRPIDEALADFDDPRNYYVCTSRYAMQVSHYLDYFDRSSLLVIEQSDLRDDRERTMRRVFAFLGVSHDFRSSHFRTEWLKREDLAGYQRLGTRLRRSILGRAFRRLPERQRLPISRGARRLLARPLPRPALDPGLHAALTEFLRPEIEELRQITREPLRSLTRPSA